jgi:hypothetical protein
MTAPKIELYMRKSILGLTPSELRIDGVSVPCKELHINLVASEPGECVLHISMHRINIIIEEDSKTQEDSNG